MEINFGDARSFKMAIVADYYVNRQNYPKLMPSTSNRAMQDARFRSSVGGS